MYEVLYCKSCFRSWERTIRRGRKPSLCLYCRPSTKPRPFKHVSPKVELVDAVSPQWETNDCTVRTIALATGRPYSEAHAFLAEHGRKRGRGVNFAVVLRSVNHEVLGKTFLPCHQLYRAKGIKTFLLRNPQFRRGTYVLHFTKHVAVLKDGKIFDSFDSSRKVIDKAWKIVS